MKSNTLTPAIICAFLLTSCNSNDEEETSNSSELSKVFANACMMDAKPITSVSDFNADGIVDNTDIELIEVQIDERTYYTLYDRNVDGVLDQLDFDIVTTESQLMRTSTILDHEIATLFNSVKHLQLTKIKSELSQLGFGFGTASLKGHGEHWLNDDGNEAITPGSDTTSSFSRVEGINAPKANGEVWALFWGAAAEPVFTNEANDYPTLGGEWMNSQVSAFSGNPPAFNGVQHSAWHTHAGLCITDGGNTLNQHMTFEECQSLPDNTRAVGELSPWLNIWMLHAWIFVPNPNGLFANTHPCLDPNEPLESSANGDRNVPQFFNHHSD